jgi:hypothetical protein
MTELFLAGGQPFTVTTVPPISLPPPPPPATTVSTAALGGLILSRDWPVVDVLSCPVTTRPAGELTSFSLAAASVLLLLSFMLWVRWLLLLLLVLSLDRLLLMLLVLSLDRLRDCRLLPKPTCCSSCPSKTEVGQATTLWAVAFHTRELGFRRNIFRKIKSKYFVSFVLKNSILNF